MPLVAPLLGLGALLAAPGAALVAAAAPTTRSAPEAGAKRFDLETSDGVTLATWYYPAAEDARPLATAILVHDLEGSHADLEPLAEALQEAGCTVAVPDLRGHGQSKQQSGRDVLEVRQLRKPDLELIAKGAGGRLRSQAAIRGDIETVHGFLVERGDIDARGERPLVVVGCGAGATLAALWTAADWSWPPLASGGQGQHVRALVMVSPLWAAKGLPLQPALASDALKRDVPLMLIGGRNDRDTVRLFEQVKKHRPTAWFDQRPDGGFTKAKDVHDTLDNATLFLMQLEQELSGQALVGDDEAGIPGRIKTFLRIVLGATPR